MPEMKTDLGHGQSQDREMHTRRSDAERAGDGRGDSCRHHPGQQVRLQGVDVQQGVEKSARIGAEAEVGRMPDGYECRKKECRHPNRTTARVRRVVVTI